MEESRDILLALGRLEGKVESLITMQRSAQEHIEGLDRRVRQLETGRSYLIGAAAAIGAFVSFIVSWVSKG
jgi:hypothetical protein